ncbi:hypothetical protein Z945_3708 [Sulfitobacter noctilucae]|uniref:Hpt domain-containing protein n=1 Tax=Sulfitobacter noctilucae TaxID=1342302 RepID=UPI00046AB849|nr:Hpt domain-containing protein [Sulfitobacter noctilucae]KIN70332.1 hypothetical protein Z945_3708 [Sulfitobacter noctilucae]
MKDLTEELPGLERIKLRFLDLLEERSSIIANCTLAAWDTPDAAVASSELSQAQSILHQIAGSAGSLGFAALGQNARKCEEAIVRHLAEAGQSDANVPVAIIDDLGQFVLMSQDLMSQGGP